MESTDGWWVVGGVNRWVESCASDLPILHGINLHVHDI